MDPRVRGDERGEFVPARRLVSSDLPTTVIVGLEPTIHAMTLPLH
jgi:hypothetical protein